MAYLSLYRKYRPQTFAQVAGQEHIVQTLQNALRYGHVANGYLFCGTRGVAKTTIARILAKCLNCTGTDGSITTPQPEPCDQCDTCRSIQAGHNVDIVELDAASNRSVSDIAKLRESVQFGPMETRYKVYIVDEAHQLSSDAKDAFLKTLEEPPANVVFILATTEAHAIPITIASRCQQFDFRRGSTKQIADQCRKVLHAEGADMPDDALAIVARAAEGSYRDALSLLDQVLAYKREGITASEVAGALGTVESETIDSALRSIAQGDQAGLFTQADDMFLRGKDVRQFLKALSLRVRDLLYVRSGASPAGMMESAEDTSSLKQLSQSFTPDMLVRILEIASEAERQTRHSDQHRLLLEMTLLKMTFTPAAVPSTPTVPAAKPISTPNPTQRNGKQPSPSATQQPQEHREPEPVPKMQPSADPEPASTSDATPSTVAAPISEPSQSVPLRLGDDAAVLRRLQSSWEEVIHHIQVRSPAGVQVAKDAKPIAAQGNMITLEFQNKSSLARLESAKRREVIEKVIDKILGRPDGMSKAKCVEAIAEPKAVEIDTKPASQEEYDDSDGPTPVLDEVISVFGGRVIEEEN